MGFSKKQARSVIKKQADGLKRSAAANNRYTAPVASNGHKRFAFALDQQLRAGLLTTPDSGDGNTIYVELKGKSFCELTVGAADETRALPAATGYAVGTELTAILRYSAGGTATISGSNDGPVELIEEGDLAVFVVSAAGAVTVWSAVVRPAIETFRGDSVGTVYAVTDTSAAVTFGTSQPVITITQPGTFRITGRLVIEFDAATFAENRVVTLKLRRTNNTPLDLPDGTVPLPSGVYTTHTGLMSVLYWDAADYTTAANDDSFTIFAGVSVEPTAGSLIISQAVITARRVS